MRSVRNEIRPLSLRQGTLAVATGVAMIGAVPAGAQAVGPVQQQAQQAEAGQAVRAADAEQEVQLDTLRIRDRTADVNPYAEDGAPYKARVSADPRRTKPLAETPQTITVVTAAQIRESGRTDLRTVLALQPGVTIGTGENGNKFGDRYILRGQELKSDVFVDGLRDPGMTTRETFAIDQVELTKGPSSTFAGRGSAGGAVNAVTKSATTEYSFANVDAIGGTDAYVRLTADLNAKLSDSVAVRVNGLYGSEDVPNRAPASRKRQGAALSALLKPADNFSVLIDYYHLTADEVPDLGTYIAAPGGKPVKNIPVYTQRGDFLRSVVNVLTTRQKWQIGEGVRLENAARYGAAQNGFVTTGARGAVRSTRDPVAPGAADIVVDNGHQGWQRISYLVDQLNLIADAKLLGMKHSLVVGGEISHNRVQNGVYVLTNGAARNCATGTSATLNAWCIGNGVANIGTVQGRSFTKGTWNTDWQVDTRSAYVMDTVDVAKWLTLFGGVRLDHYDYTLAVQNTTTLVQTPYGYTGTLWNYHAGVSLKPVDDGQFYLAFGTASNINGGESDVGTNCGYGGFCTVTGSGYYGSPVRTKNYEIGTKWELFGHRLLVTAAAFRLVKDGVFESPNGDSYSQIGSLNTGRYRVKGLEFGLVGNITPRLSGQVGVTIMNSKVLGSIVPANVGLKLANFANNQANAQLRYQLTDGVAIGGNVNYKSSMAAGQPDAAAGWSTALGDYSYKVPAYTTFDLFGTVKLSRRLEARVNVQNVGNADYYLAAYRSGTFVYIGDKRRVTFALSGKF